MITLLLALAQRFGALFHRWPGFVRICHGLVGADRRILARAPKPEQAAHTAMGVLMLLAALWTGTTMSLKLATLAASEPGPAMHALLFAFFFALGLSMESAVLATLKSGHRHLVAVRLALSLCLVSLQVLPLGVMAFQERIEFELHQRTLSSVASSQGLSARARGVDALRANAGDLQAKLDSARRIRQSPGPAPQAVLDAEAAQAATQGKLIQATRALEDSRRRAAQWRAKLAIGQPTERERERLESALKAANEKVAKRQGEVNAADAAAENARTAAVVAQRDWRASLEAQVHDADEAIRQHEATLAQAASQQAVDVARVEQLATKANKASFFTSLGMLVSLSMHDITILVALAFCLTVAALIDLLPLLTKMALQTGVHARGVATRETVEVERLRLYEDQARLLANGERLQAHQQHDALAKWAAVDQGATQAQELALQAQRQLDEARLSASAKLIGAHADATRKALQRLLEVQTLADANPALGTVWRTQLARLIDALDNPAGAVRAVASAPAR